MDQRLIELHEAKLFLSKKIPFQPKLGIILGSGLSKIVDTLKDSNSLSYDEIPHFPKPKVEGHQGRLHYGSFNKVPTIILSGRAHAYEGHTQDKVVFAARTLGLLGVKTLLVTNAAGGINPKFKPGNLMLITDHINLTGMHPLLGANLEELGPRFPDMSDAYSQDLRKKIKSLVRSKRLPLREGVYLALSGPSYETPAEIKMLRKLGADAVGMSTVFEVLAANHMGTQVVGISMITNMAAGMTKNKLNHKEVTATALKTVDSLSRILTLVAPALVGK